MSGGSASSSSSTRVKPTETSANTTGLISTGPLRTAPARACADQSAHTGSPVATSSSTLVSIKVPTRSATGQGEYLVGAHPGGGRAPQAGDGLAAAITLLRRHRHDGDAPAGNDE